jgi:hypothetical protein
MYEIGFVGETGVGLDCDLDQDRIHLCSLPRSVDIHSIITFG